MKLPSKGVSTASSLSSLLELYANESFVPHPVDTRLAKWSRLPMPSDDEASGRPVACTTVAPNADSHIAWTLDGKNLFETREQFKSHLSHLRNVLDGKETLDARVFVSCELSHQQSHESVWERVVNWFTNVPKVQTGDLTLDQTVLTLDQVTDLSIEQATDVALALTFDLNDAGTWFPSEPYFFAPAISYVTYYPCAPSTHVLERLRELFSSLLRYVDESICRLLRALERPNRLHEFIGKQRSWHLLHGARPPRSSGSFLNPINLLGVSPA